MKRHHLAALIALSLALASGNAAAQQAQPAQPAAVTPYVRMHLKTFRGKGTARAFLHRTDGTYSFVCASPCTADVPANGEMRVTLANNDDEPHTFAVPGDLGPEVEIEVRPASVGPLIGSIVMMGSGGAFALCGLLLIALSDVGPHNNGIYQNNNSGDLKTAGFVLIGIGGAAAVAGLIWLSTRSREPRVNDSPYRVPEVYGRAATFLGDVAVAKPRSPTPATPAFAPLSYGFTF